MRWMLLLVAVVAAGCGSSSGYARKGSVSYDAEMVAPKAAMVPAAEESGAVPMLGLIDVSTGDFDGRDRVPFTLGKGGWEDGILAVGTPEELAGQKRLIVYSGSFSVAVGNVEEAQDAARAMAEGLGGHFQSLKKDTITLRVPAAKWDDAVTAIGDLGRVLDRAIDASDVTEEVIDLRLRLRNAQKMMARLEELLARAETVEAALKVEKELGRVRVQVEQLEGRLQFLGDRIAFSTLTIRFRQVQETAVRPQALPFPWLSNLSLESLLGLPGGAR